MNVCLYHVQFHALAKANHIWKNHLNKDQADAVSPEVPAVQTEAAVETEAPTEASAEHAGTGSHSKFFKNHDLDGNGDLDLVEFTQAYQKIDPNASDADITAMFKEADTDGNNTLDVDEVSLNLEGPLHEVVRNFLFLLQLLSPSSVSIGNE